MEKLTAPRRAVIIFIAAVLILAVLLLGVIFLQGKRINAQEERIGQQQEVISAAAGRPRPMPSQGPLPIADTEAAKLQTDFDTLQEKQLESEAEISRLKAENLSISQALAGLQEKASGPKEDKERLEAETASIKAELALRLAESAAAPPLTEPRETGGLVKKNKALAAQIDQLRSDKKNLEIANKKLGKINSQLESKAKALFLEAKDKQRLAEQVKELNQATGLLAKERSSLVKNIERLQKSVADLKLENTGLYAKAGDAYMLAGLTDDAITSFNDALRLNPKNAGAHYKLGFLYKRSVNNNLKAVYHFKKYLALEPGAKNRKEVEYLIQLLSQDDWEK